MTFEKSPHYSIRMQGKLGSMSPARKIYLAAIALAWAATWANSAPRLVARRSSTVEVPSSRDPSGSWEPALLYSVLNSPNAKARHLLYRATFAAGPAIVPQLKAALQDDRTATFAARSLAYIGGKRARAILATLVNDPRNLDLRRFYYGALGETTDPQALTILLDKVRISDQEPDRSVTQDALLALTVHSNTTLAAEVRQLRSDVTDPVIEDDIQNAADIIQIRAQDFAQHPALATAHSIPQAIHNYFLPALAPPPNPSKQPPFPPTRERIVSLTFSPNRTRALAHVVFETPQALANYELVVQEIGGQWKVASVWLGSETKRGPSSGSAPAARR